MMHNVQARSHMGRGGFLKVRSPRPEVAAATPVVQAVDASSTSSVVSIQLPTTTKSLIVVMSVVGSLIVIGILLCRIRAWRKKRSNASSVLGGQFSNGRYVGETKINLTGSDSEIEKPQNIYHLEPPVPFDTQVGWVPQIRPGRFNRSQNEKTQAAQLSPSKWEKSISTFAPSIQTPPPSYFVANGGDGHTSMGPSIPLPPTPTELPALPPTPPTPPASARKFRTLTPPSPPLPTTLAFPDLSVPADTTGPLPSPARSSSFAHQQEVGKKRSTQRSSNASGSSHSDSKLPRLMTVANTFNPSLDDELLVVNGETVRMLEEYLDGWCLVQRVGKFDSPKGVVPRICLTEREGLLPSSGSHVGSRQMQGWR